MQNILYLYREVMPYNIPVFKVFVSEGYHVTVIHDVVKRQTPYLPPEINGVTFYPKENFTQAALNELAIQLNPLVTFVSDRTNPIYNRATMLLRRKFKSPVIVGCDTQWKGGRQWVNVLTSFFRHKRFYSHILVAGMRQFEYAKRLGFRNNKILWPLYSADIDLFNRISIDKDKFTGPRNFLFVGRFVEVKGIANLLKAWESLAQKNNATLTLIGNGPLKAALSFPGDVKVLDFMNQEELLRLAAESSCFILPSLFEPWALVLHEFAATGLPIITTSACGASSQFVINNYNGFVVEPNDIDGLSNALNKIIKMEPEQLNKFAKRSKELSSAISPQLVSNAILSVVNT